MTANWNEFCLSFIPKVKSRHRQMLGRECDLDNPKRLTDKLEWLKIYDSNMLKTYCADKILLRKYARWILGRDICFPILGIYDKFSDINFNNLPANYIMKTNHGSHTNIIVKDHHININTAESKFADWMSKDWSWWGYELHYIPIKRKIFIEPLMANDAAGLNDYKFWCFNGEPRFFTINSGRPHAGIRYFNMDCSVMNVVNTGAPPDPSETLSIPYTFNEMVAHSRQLSKPFKFVRVDFYEIDRKCYLGEMTFIPGAAYIRYDPDAADVEFGEFLTL